MVFAAPERWGQGIGAELMDYLHDQMRAREWEIASLWTRASNHPARRLYARLGYSQATDITDLVGGMRSSATNCDCVCSPRIADPDPTGRGFPPRAYASAA